MARPDPRHNHARKAPAATADIKYYLGIITKSIIHDRRRIEYVQNGGCGNVACDACCGRRIDPPRATHMVKNAHGPGWNAKLCTECAKTVATASGTEIINDMYQRGTGLELGRAVHLPSRYGA